MTRTHEHHDRPEHGRRIVGCVCATPCTCGCTRHPLPPARVARVPWWRRLLAWRRVPEIGELRLVDLCACGRLAGRCRCVPRDVKPSNARDDRPPPTPIPGGVPRSG